MGGLQKPSIDFVEGIVEIENVAVWSPNKKFDYLKNCPKNGEERFVPLNSRLREIFKRRFHEDELNNIQSNFVFHQDGLPLSYRTIQYRYNKALKRAGLDHKYSATHILRHTMANMVRGRKGLDSAQAVGGWKTRDLVERVYTDVPTDISAEALQDIESYLTANGEPFPSDSKAGLRLIKK